MSEDKLYYRYWGKADRKDPAKYHLLPYHCLDVAAVAQTWWKNSKVIRQSFLRHSGLDEEMTMAWVLFFIGLHDYGKFDVRFQRKADHVRQQLSLELNEDKLPSLHLSKEFDHGPAGLYWFLRDHGDRFDFNVDINIDNFDLFKPESTPNNDWNFWRDWLEMVCGHHGFIHRDDFLKDWRLPTRSSALAQSEQKARRAWVRCLERIFLSPCGLKLSDNPPPPSPLLAGFCSVTDWLGSRSDEHNFHFLKTPLSPRHYIIEKIDDAGKVLKLSGIIGERKPYKGVSKLLPEGANPRGIQQLVDDLPCENGLTIVEAPTGSGKTEMAMAYAWRLLEKGCVESIIFALPTQATANKMYDRLTPLAVKMFKDHPNLLLAHGNARFNEKFIAIKRATQSVQKEGEAWVQCCEWLSQSRKRVFLGQIGVCTVDQVLIAVLPVRHRFVRGFGAGRSVLIVDEVHAYDAYMYGLMQQVLKDQKAAGGSTVLLSATLPAHQRRKLLYAWGIDLEPEGNLYTYPLITWAGPAKFHEFHLLGESVETTKQHTVQTECKQVENMRPDKTLLDEMVTAAKKGAQVALVCNLVGDAQQAYELIKRMSGMPVLLFHSRYTLKDRMKIEEKVDRCFGKHGNRSIGRILIGTQVLEQSLDYDVDWMITQLCPVDLLFQRMGRLHRHNRYRPDGFKSPRCTILLPFAEGYGDHNYIYGNTLVMWRTARKLNSGIGLSIYFPDAYREWIEEIYDDKIIGNEPQWVLDGFETFLCELAQKEIAAKQMIKWSQDSWLSDTDQNIQAVTRDGEMSLQVVPFVQEQSGRRLIDGCIVEQLQVEKIPEALAINSVNVPRNWERLLKTIEKNDVVWLPMNDDKGKLITEIGKRKLTYTNELGLKKNGE